MPATLTFLRARVRKPSRAEAGRRPAWGWLLRLLPRARARAAGDIYLAPF